MHSEIFLKSDMPDLLQRSVFGDRAQQFVSRLKWNLCVTPTGLEVDEYDDSESQYLLVHRNSGHLGSCRVRPITASTMLVDHFLPLFPQAQSFLEMQRGRVFELTRFCRAPDISVGESRQMLAKLACLLDSFRDAQRLTGFVAVVFPQVCRFLDSIGVRYLVISKSQLDGREVDLICITHAKRVGAKADPAPMMDVTTPRLAA